MKDNKKKTPNKNTKTKKNIKTNETKKTTTSKSTKGKKILEIEPIKESKPKNLNDTIQSFTSILFTIIIFIALLLIIFVIYNNYLKPQDNLQDACKDIYEKDYGITSTMIDNYIINSRVMLYNVENYDKEKIDNQKLTEIATYLIWGSTDKLEMCSDDEKYCLTTKITMPYKTLLTYFKNYLNISDVDLTIEQEYLEGDTIRLYKDNSNIVLTFSEFEFETLRHNLAYQKIDGDKVTLVFALEAKNNDTYRYVGSKVVDLKLINKNLTLESIKTTYKESK